MIRIQSCDTAFVREPLASPFGFKGGYLTELWQAVVKVTADGVTACCPGTQSVLWSDPKVFASFPPEKADEIMFSVTKRAAQMLCGQSFSRPDELIPQLMPDLKEYARSLTGFDTADTFILNSLVGLDTALWSIWAIINRAESFGDIIPEDVRPAMSCRHSRLAKIPLISYAVTEERIRALVDSGAALLKIKIGAPSGENPGSEADMRGMLERDCRRISQIHSIARNAQTDLTDDGKVRYYLDANGRYDGKERLCALLEHIDRIGAADRVSLIEEPFAPDNLTEVGDIPFVLNADESAHSLADVRARLSLGYRAVALKPIAKTLSVSFSMIKAIHEAGGQALCADLTVNPLLAEWNKQFAARISPLGGFRAGCVEINGDENYLRWRGMYSMLPDGYVPAEAAGGSFALGDDFYDNSRLLFGVNGCNKYFGV